LQQILHEDKATGAFVIPSGRLGIDPTMVLGSAQMRDLLADLAREFDLVWWTRRR
jgi:hypothetical protein